MTELVQCLAENGWDSVRRSGEVRMAGQPFRTLHLPQQREPSRDWEDRWHMASSRRRGDESSATRALLLEAAEDLMREEGYPAVTTRRLAGRVGVSNQLVHYYFRTMDDL